MDDSFNYPLSLLLARLLAMQGEADSFTAISGRLLDILAHETRSLPRREHNMLRARGGGPEPLLPGRFSGSCPPDHIYMSAPPVAVGTGRKRVPRREAGGVGKMLPEQGRSR